jgi:hypothetical protein
MSPLWTEAREIIRTLFSCCGEPQDIAQQGFINRRLYDHVLAWIRAGEILLRRMLLIEAMAQSGSPAPPPAQHTREPRQRTLVEVFPDKPDDWRVSFRFTHKVCARSARKPLQGAPLQMAQKRGLEARSASRNVFSTWPLALRAEALLRICNNPAPYIARLARLIARAPKRIARMLAPLRQRKRKSGDPPAILDIIGRETWVRIETASPNTS